MQFGAQSAEISVLVICIEKRNTMISSTGCPHGRARPVWPACRRRGGVLACWPVATAARPAAATGCHTLYKYCCTWWWRLQSGGRWRGSMLPMNCFLQAISSCNSPTCVARYYWLFVGRFSRRPRNSFSLRSANTRRIANSDPQIRNSLIKLEVLLLDDVNTIANSDPQICNSQTL